ncbi:MAG: PorT family protein [Cyclobacteriaceae bacterium]|nr:PorT family protein [Cyclobacteriaceae bacterium]
MNKYYLLILCLFLTLNQAFSQEVELGVKGGMNISTLGKSELGNVARIAYHFGGTAEFITTPFFSIQTELMYSLQGAATDQSRQVYLNYHYLNIPLLAKAYFYEDASFEIGVQYGLLLKAVDKNEFYSQDRSDEVSNSDFAVVFGLNYKLDEKFTFGFRYNLGITNTAKQDIIYEKRYTNRVLLISLGYIL